VQDVKNLCLFQLASEEQPAGSYVIVRDKPSNGSGHHSFHSFIPLPAWELELMASNDSVCQASKGSATLLALNSLTLLQDTYEYDLSALLLQTWRLALLGSRPTHVRPYGW